jgi:hypothetical protein
MPVIHQVLLLPPSSGRVCLPARSGFNINLIPVSLVFSPRLLAPIKHGLLQLPVPKHVSLPSWPYIMPAFLCPVFLSALSASQVLSLPPSTAPVISSDLHTYLQSCIPPSLSLSTLPPCPRDTTNIYKHANTAPDTPNQRQHGKPMLRPRLRHRPGHQRQHPDLALLRLRLRAVCGHLALQDLRALSLQFMSYG